MSSNQWKELYFKEITELLYGKSLPAKKRIFGKYNVYGSGGIVGKHSNYLAEGPGIIIGRKGTVGSVYFEKNSYFPIDTTYYIKNSPNYDIKYLFYLLCNANLTKMNTHSAVPGLNRDNLYHKKFKVPKIEEQEKIASILSSLDDKIELNNQINKNLEEITQAIFKHWFVDFEFPDENGEPYKSSGGEMLDSELFSIPKRWRIIRLDKLIKRNKQKIKNMKDWENKKLIDLSVMPRFSFCVNNFEKGSKLKTNIYKLNKFDILFGSIRPYFGKAGFSPINGVVAGTIFSYSPVRENLYSYILCLTTNKSFIDFTVKHSRGTKMPIIHWDDFVSYKIVVPEDDKLLESFNNMIMLLLKEIKENINMNQDFSDMRDILLPKLMSGEIRVPINSRNFSQLK